LKCREERYVVEMSGNVFGNVFRISTWGESHGKAVGCVVDGCPSNLELSEKDIQKELDRRKPGGRFASKRMEKDEVELLSGIFEGKTTGAPISMIVYNRDVKSEHYENIRSKPRPGHADLTYWIKYKHRDWRGGGRSSARETVGRVAGGAVAKKILGKYGIKVIGYSVEIGGVSCEIKAESEEDYLKIFKKSERSELRVPERDAEKRIAELIENVRKEGDSLGGIAEIVILNPPAGIGDPVFNRFSALLSFAIMSVPAVRGVEVGSGFKVSRMRGSENNDPIVLRNGEIKLLTNNCGGVLGGITTGTPVVLRVAIKPTPSISKLQRTVDLDRMEEVELRIEGRHDPCIVPRAIPVLEAMCAMALVDQMMIEGIIPRSF
jgi:chorismate synthase